MPKKHTLKKKSKSRSLTQPGDKPGLFIFDVTGGKLVARVLHEGAAEYALTYPASLTFPIEALESGQRFSIKASLMGIVGVDKLYFLPKAALKGYCVCEDAWLHRVFARFEARALAGEFRLNPYAKQETAELMQGDGEAEAETTDVTIIESPKEEPTPPEESAHA